MAVYCSAVQRLCLHDDTVLCACQTTVEPNHNPSTPVIRRYRRNGAIHFICRLCLVSIGTAYSDGELDTLEAAHVCDSIALEHSGLRPREALATSASRYTRH